MLYTVQFALFCLTVTVYMLFDMLIASITFISQIFLGIRILLYRKLKYVYRQYS